MQKQFIIIGSNHFFKSEHESLKTTKHKGDKLTFKCQTQSGI